MVSARSYYVDTALHIIKGAACIAFSIPTGGTTKTVKNFPTNKGSISLKCDSLNDGDWEVFKSLVYQKISENAKFRVIKLPRTLAESVYGHSMYDSFAVPQNITNLRLILLDEWNINASINPILKSTKLVGDIKFENPVFNKSKSLVEIIFHISPDPDLKAEFPIEEEIESIDLCPNLQSVLPPSGVEKQINYSITPWTAEDVDYDKIIREFGCKKITPELLKRMQEVLPGKKLHHLLTREIFFSHKDLDIILDKYEKGEKFYVYTGRGPSSTSLHLGHLIPLIFTKWLQEAFGVLVVIMISDDEKYLFKEGLQLDKVREMAEENIKDIIACGFDLNRTFIFSNIEYIQHLYPTILQIQKKLPFNQVKGIFGFNNSDNIGKIAFPAVEGSCAFSSSFPTFFKSETPCLVPQGIDQDAFFRMTRDIAPRMGYVKPAVIHSKFIPSLQGSTTKMSSSDPQYTIFVSDTPDAVRAKINKHAFSGGGDTAELQRLHGANLEVDVSYQYLRMLMEDDEELNRIGLAYSKGEMQTSEVKRILSDLICKIFAEHKERKSLITDEDIYKFKDPYYPRKL